MFPGFYTKKWVCMMALFHAVAVQGLCLSSCTSLPKTMETSSQHISLPESTSLEPQNDVPPLAETVPLPPPPKASKAAERYSVVVNNVLAQEILFALARDAKVNIEIHPNISGTVTMNLIDQTLPEILDAIARQIDIRYELNGRNLAIMPDSPYLKSYQVDYPNVSRNSENSISTSTSVAAIGGAGGGSNSSSSTITNTSNNHFWKTLVENLKDLLRETDKIMPENIDETTPLPQTATSGMGGEPDALDSDGSSVVAVKSQGQAPQVTGRVTYREAASVIANQETGAISVRANSRQHASVQAFLDKVMVSARRQVLIEATIVEVSLSNQYQQGIDWSVLSNTSGLSYTQISPVSAAMVALGTLNYFNPGNPNGGTDLSSTIKLLETFGKLHVLSSPKLSVLNNQTSLLKVVDEAVYFTVDVTPGTAATVSSPAVAPTYESTIHTVPVGFLMYVTPQIGGDSEVTLNLRPTISRIHSYVNDPNPIFAENNVVNRIPQIQTREMESILRVRNGEIAVLGGLMQDSLSGTSHKVPGVGNVFGIGEFFKDRDDTNSKSELVIFLRPIILDQERQYDVLNLFKNPTTTAEWQQNNLSARSSP